MTKLALLVALAISLTGASAFANSSTSLPAGSFKLAQLDVCVGPNCGDRGRRDRDRHDRDHDRDFRLHHDHGCRDVTVRDHRDDETVVRHMHRCG